jgi:branched-chain amino acid transport system ATP-binding protein
MTAATRQGVQIDGLAMHFGGVKAIDGVSFDVAGGSLTALIGPNGAGKTSLFNCMSGIYRPTLGTITVEGVNVTGLRQHRIARLGVARTFQTPALFPGLDVLGNLMAGRYRHGKGGMIAGMLRLPNIIADEVRQREKAEEILELLEISAHRHAEVQDLPYGLQKRVELGRALVQDPAVLLLDEPMAGMTVDEKEDMSAFILSARAELGCTVVLIEHDMGVVMDLAEHIVVLDFGRKIGDGTPAEVRANPAVISAYLGTEAEDEVVAVALGESGDSSESTAGVGGH